MRRVTHRIGLAVAAGVAALALAGATVGQSLLTSTPHLPVGHVPTPPQLLRRPLPPGTPAQVAQGRYLTIAGDCAACHTRAEAAPFSGGRAIVTPFGVIYSPNLTGDKDTGIGGWTPDQFWSAMHTGRDDQGHHLYPAFPYVYFTKVTRPDSDAILSYLKTVPAVHAEPPANGLPFPLNIRAIMMGWNLLFFRPHDFQPDASRSAEWNRGAYLSQSLEHCGACHTPKNPLGGDVNSRPYVGGLLDNWYAPNLTGERLTGLGGWSRDDIVEYLKTGRNAYAQAAGPMAEVVSDSTSLMTDADLRAIAVYIKDRPPDRAPEQATAPDARALAAGRAVYEDSCSGCHYMAGQGVPRFFPPLRGAPDVQSVDPTNTVRVILEGARTSPSPTRPSAMSMPSFAWKLTDAQIADVASYVRNSWGNQASAVEAPRVATLRRKLGLATSHPSSWSRQ